MLDIPVKIKELLKTDGILKNVRIIFEDANYPDICNDKIVKESLKFVESLSSQEVIKFGLCEDSMLSFQCVDPGDVRDKYIKAYIEIDGTELYEDKYAAQVGKPYALYRLEDNLSHRIVVVPDFEHEGMVNDGSGLTVEKDSTYTYLHGIDVEYLEEMFNMTFSRQSTSIDISNYGIGVYANNSAYYKANTFIYDDDEKTRCTLRTYPMPAAQEYIEELFGYPYYVALKNIYYSGKTDEVLLEAPEDQGGESGAIFPYYSIPLGRFRIEECKLDVTKGLRRIQAYTVMPDFYHPSAANKVLMNIFPTASTAKNMKINFNPFNYALTNNAIKFDFPFTYTDATLTEYPLTYSFPGEGNYSFKISLKRMVWGTQLQDGWSNTLIYLGEQPEFKTSVLNSFLAIYNENKSHFSASIQAQIEAAIRRICDNHYYAEQMCDGTREDPTIGNCDYRLDFEAFQLPLISSIVSWAEVTVKDGNTVIASLDRDLYTAPYDVKDVSSNVNISYKLAPQKEDYVLDGTSYIRYSFYDYLNTLDVRKALESVMELKGWFGGINRQGRFAPYALDDVDLGVLFPANDLFPADDLYPADFDQDESGDTDMVIILTDDDTLSLQQELEDTYYGSITCTYLSSDQLDDDGNPMEVTYSNTWDDSGMIYDASDNYVIKNGIYTDAWIRGALNRLITVLKKIRYRRSVIKIIGLPYMEAGDHIIASARGVGLLNVVLKRTMTGIQGLIDKTESD